MRRRWSFLAVPAVALGLLVVGAPVTVLAQSSENDCLATTPPGCYAPQQFLTAYDIQPLRDRGIYGRGKTVSMPEHFPGPTASPRKSPTFARTWPPSTAGSTSLLHTSTS